LKIKNDSQSPIAITVILPEEAPVRNINNANIESIIG